MGKKKSTSKSSSKSQGTSTNTNLLTQNQTYTNLFNQAVNGANSAEYVDLERAGMDAEYEAALAKYAQGLDTTEYTNASNELRSRANNIRNTSEEAINNYQSKIDRIGSMSASDINSMVQAGMNSDLVNSQIKQLTENTNEQLGQAVKSLDQRAAGSGNMGNSRAGVAQGVMQGQAFKAIASGTADIQGREEAASTNRLQMYLGNALSTAQTGLNTALANRDYANNLYSQGMQYYGMGQQVQAQNNQQALYAGGVRRTEAQAQIDLDRYNAMQRSNPAMYRLGLINQNLAPYASMYTQGNTTGSSSSKETVTSGGGMGQAIGGLVGGVAGGMLGSVVPGVGTAFGMTIGSQLGAGVGGAM